MQFDFLHRYYTTVAPNRRVLELCGALEPGAPYSTSRDPELTVIINAFARPQYLPLIWESVRYQTRAPQEIWILQNHAGARAAPPRELFGQLRSDPGTRVIDADLNLGCWFRFFLAALMCRTRYLAVLDDDTLPARRALEAALDDLAARPGLYGGRGVTYKPRAGGPRYASGSVSGWPAGTVNATEVDFVGHLWVTETWWLKDLLKNIPDHFLKTAEPGLECGEDMYLSFVAQRAGLPTFVYGHGVGLNERWSSIQAYEMGRDRNAMSMSGGLKNGDLYLRTFVEMGWKLIHYR